LGLSWTKRIEQVKKVLIIGTGDMAKGCPGKLGDGLIVGALAAYIHNRDIPVHLVTNPIAAGYLRYTYDYTVSAVEQEAGLPGFCRTLPEPPGWVVILKPQDDPIAADLKNHLIREMRIPSTGILHIGDLDAFHHNQHIIWQLAHRILPPIGLEIPSSLFPRVFRNISVDHTEDAPGTLVLPVAGSRVKQLSAAELEHIGMNEDADLQIAGTRFKDDLKFMRHLYSHTSNIPPSAFLNLSVDELLRLAFHSRKIISADSGLLWLVTAFLNDWASCGLISKQQYPEVVVVRKDHKPGVPAFAIWHPLLVFSDKLDWIRGR
jgi:hypothetical protein